MVSKNVKRSVHRTAGVMKSQHSSETTQDTRGTSGTAEVLNSSSQPTQLWAGPTPPPVPSDLASPTQKATTTTTTTRTPTQPTQPTHPHPSEAAVAPLHGSLGADHAALLCRSARSLTAVSMTASSIVDQGEYFFDDDFSVQFDAHLREENNNNTSDGLLDSDDLAGARSDPNLTSSLLFTSAEGEVCSGGPLWSDEGQRSSEEEEEEEEREEEEEEEGEEMREVEATSASYLSQGSGADSEPNPAVASLLRRSMRGEYRLTYCGQAGSFDGRRAGAVGSASMEFQVSATTSGGTAADSECSSGSNLSTWASLARSNSPASSPGGHRTATTTEDSSSAPSTLKAARPGRGPGGRLTTWSQVHSSRESMAPASSASLHEKPSTESVAEADADMSTDTSGGPPQKLTTWKQMKQVASSKFVSWRELKDVVRVANATAAAEKELHPSLPPQPPPPPPPPPTATPPQNLQLAPPDTAAKPDAVSPTAVQMRGRAALRQSGGEPGMSLHSAGRSHSADAVSGKQNRNRFSGTLLELFKRTHDYDAGAHQDELTAPPPAVGAAEQVKVPWLMRRSCSISPIRGLSGREALAAARASPAEWFGRLFSDNSLSPVCSFECGGRENRGCCTTTTTTMAAAGGKEYRNFGAQFPPTLPPGVKLRPRSKSQQVAPTEGWAGLLGGKEEEKTEDKTAAKRITYPNAQALKVPLPAKSKRLVSSAWGNVGSTSQSMMALPDLSFLSRHLTRLKEQEMASSLIHTPPKLRRSNSCAGSVNRNPASSGTSDSPPDSGINTSADSIPVAYDLIQLDGEPLLVSAGPLKTRPASSEPDLLTADLSDLTSCRKGSKPLKPCLVRPRGSDGGNSGASGGDLTASMVTTASSESTNSSSCGGAGGPGGPGEFRAKKSVSFSEKILFHQAPGKGAAGKAVRARPLSLVDTLRVIPNKVGIYGDDDFCMAFAPVCSPETSPVKETGPSVDDRSTSEIDRRYIALVDEVIQSVHRMVAHFSAEAGTICGPPMATLLPPLSTLVCDGLNMGNGRAAGLFAKFRNRLWPVIEESCRQGVSHRVLSEVLREVKALPGITTEKTKFKAFVCACLNAKCLPMWLNAVATNESLLRRHFCEDAFLRQATSSQRELFADLITSLELLLGLPFRLDVAAEAKRATHSIVANGMAATASVGTATTPTQVTPSGSGSSGSGSAVTGHSSQPLRARHDIKVRHHHPLAPSSSSSSGGSGDGGSLKGRWRYAFGIGSGGGSGGPASTAAAGSPHHKAPASVSRTRIPVVAAGAARSGSPATRRGEAS